MYTSSLLTVRRRGRSSGDTALIAWGYLFSLIGGANFVAAPGADHVLFQVSRCFNWSMFGVFPSYGSSCWGQSSFQGVKGILLFPPLYCFPFGIICILCMCFDASFSKRFLYILLIYISKNNSTLIVSRNGH